MLLRMCYSLGLNFLVVLRLVNRPVLIRQKKITINTTCTRQKNDSTSGHSNAIRQIKFDLQYCIINYPLLDTFKTYEICTIPSQQLASN